MTDKELLYNWVDKIQDNDIRKITLTALDRVADKFWTAPASTSGKYHPKYALGEGGLVRHTIAVCYLVSALFDTTILYGEGNRDLLIAAAVLHDTCKCGVKFQNEYTVFEHPILVHQLLDDDELKDINHHCARDLWQDITMLIASHMGKWRVCSTKEFAKRSESIKTNLECYAKRNKTALGWDSQEPDIAELALPAPHTDMAKLLHLADYLASRKEISLNFFKHTDGLAEEISKLTKFFDENI